VAPELAYQLERFEPHVIAAAGDALNAVADAALALTGIGRSDSSPALFRLTMPWDCSTFLAPRVDRSPVGASPSDPYMLYFTSGTSGTPKVGPGSYCPSSNSSQFAPSSFIESKCIL
jgi:acyl-coenzyme A synthetase/AMP-(fatty) acid ligase